MSFFSSINNRGSSTKYTELYYATRDVILYFYKQHIVYRQRDLNYAIMRCYALVLRLYNACRQQNRSKLCDNVMLYFSSIDGTLLVNSKIELNYVMVRCYTVNSIDMHRSPVI